MPRYRVTTEKGTYIVTTEAEDATGVGKALTTANQASQYAEMERPRITNPVEASLKAASEFIPGTLYATQYYAHGGPFNPQAHAQAQQIAEPYEWAEVTGMPAQLAYGATAAAPILAGAAHPFVGGVGAVGRFAARRIPSVAGRAIGTALQSPFVKSTLGMAAYEGARQLAGGQPQNVLSAMGEGLKSGALYYAGGRLGATAGQPLMRLTRQGTRIGSAVGSGLTSSALAPEGEKLTSGMIGAAFGYKYPSEPIGYRSPAQLRQDAARIYGKLLEPPQPLGRKYERRRKPGEASRFDRLMTIASEENLPLKLTPEKDSRRLDTSEARDIVSGRMNALEDRLTRVLASEKTKRFSLKELGRRAKISLTRNRSPELKNALALREAKAMVDRYIDAEIQRYGVEYISASQLQTVKQGLQKIANFDKTPASNITSALMSRQARLMIERGVRNKSVNTINRRIGEYAELNNLLLSKHDSVVKGGMLGRYVGQTIGAVAGSKIPILGPIAGAYAGGKVAQMMQNPKLATSLAGKKIRRAEQIEGRTFPLDVAIGRQTRQLAGQRGEAFGKKKEEKKIPPSDFIKLEQKILAKSKIPDSEIPKYVQSSVADGERLREYTNQAVNKNMTPKAIAEAAEKVKADYMKLEGKPIAPAKKIQPSTKAPLTAEEAVKRGISAEEWVASKEIANPHETEVVNIQKGDLITGEYFGGKFKGEVVSKHYGTTTGRESDIIFKINTLSDFKNSQGIGRKKGEVFEFQVNPRTKIYSERNLGEINKLNSYLPSEEKSQLLSEYDAAKAKLTTANALTAGKPIQPKSVAEWDNYIDRNNNKIAIHKNVKTGESLEFGTSCTRRESGFGPCLYCYVEAKRLGKEMGMSFQHGKTIVETPYKGEILLMPDAVVKKHNKNGGLRMSSWSDYRPKVDYENVANALKDAQKKGLFIKAITKEKALVDDFGDHPNMRFNISTDNLPRSISNAPTIEEAMQWKAGRKNIKIRTVVMNDEQALEALLDPRIDVVTGYHGYVKENLLKIVKKQNPDIGKRLPMEKVEQELMTWRNISPERILKLAKEKGLDAEKLNIVRRICCQGGKCESDPTKCGFAGMQTIIGLLLPTVSFIKSEEDKDFVK